MCREARRASREEMARIAALRSHDYEEDLRLAQRTRDKRLRTLLDKTQAIITELQQKVARRLCGGGPCSAQLEGAWRGTAC